MPQILRLRRYSRAYHNDIEWINGAFLFGKWSKESADPY